MKKRLSILAALAVGATSLIAPATAHAAEANQCWTKVATGETRCFTTFAAVVADLSGGQVKVSGAASSFTQAQATASAAASTGVTAMIVYEDANYGGASTTYRVADNCDSSVAVNYQFSLVGTPWNDRISSFKSYSNCESKIWVGLYSGSSYGFVVNTTYVGATLNDEASSIQWR